MTNINYLDQAFNDGLAQRIGDVKDRLDQHFHKPRFRKLVKNLKAVGSKSIGSLIRYSKEVWDKSGGRFCVPVGVNPKLWMCS